MARTPTPPAHHEPSTTHVFDVLKDVPSFQSEYTVVLQQLLTYSGLVLLYIGKVQADFDVQNSGISTMKQDFLRCGLTLADFPEDLREEIVEGFVNIVARIREEGKMRKLTEPISTYFLKDGSNALTRTYGNHPSTEITSVLGEQLQFLVSELVPCCVSSESEGIVSIATLQQLVLQSDSSLFEYVKLAKRSCDLAPRVLTPSFLPNLVGQCIGQDDLLRQCCRIVSRLMRTYGNHPSSEITSVLGEQLQFLVSELVPGCISSESEGMASIATLHQLVLQSDSSLFEYVKERDPFPEPDLFAEIGRFHEELTKGSPSRISPVYALIGLCNDVILRLCGDIVLVKSEVAELPVPQVMANLERRRELDVDLCKLISLQGVRSTEMGLSLQRTLIEDNDYVSLTTIFAIKCNEYIVLGADSRTTYPLFLDISSDNFVKIRKLRGSIFFLLCGSVALGLRVVHEVRERLKNLPNNHTVREVVDFVVEETNRHVPWEMGATYIVGGGCFPPEVKIGEPCTDFDLYVISKEEKHRAQFERKNRIAYGGSGGANDADLERKLRHRMSEKEAFHIVFSGLRCAAKFDRPTGGILRAISVKRTRTAKDKMRSRQPNGGKCFLPYHPLSENFIGVS